MSTSDDREFWFRGDPAVPRMPEQRSAGGPPPFYPGAASQEDPLTGPMPAVEGSVRASLAEAQEAALRAERARQEEERQRLERERARLEEERARAADEAARTSLPTRYPAPPGYEGSAETSPQGDHELPSQVLTFQELKQPGVVHQETPHQHLERVPRYTGPMRPSGTPEGDVDSGPHPVDSDAGVNADTGAGMSAGSDPTDATGATAPGNQAEAGVRAVPEADYASVGDVQRNVSPTGDTPTSGAPTAGYDAATNALPTIASGIGQPHVPAQPAGTPGPPGSPERDEPRDRAVGGQAALPGSPSGELAPHHADAVGQPSGVPGQAAQPSSSARGTAQPDPSTLATPYQAADQDNPGQGAAVQGAAGQGAVGQGIAGQGAAGQGSAEQGYAGQVVAGSAAPVPPARSAPETESGIPPSLAGMLAQTESYEQVTEPVQRRPGHGVLPASGQPAPPAPGTQNGRSTPRPTTAVIAAVVLGTLLAAAPAVLLLYDALLRSDPVSVSGTVAATLMLIGLPTLAAGLAPMIGTAAKVSPDGARDVLRPPWLFLLVGLVVLVAAGLAAGG